MIQPILPYVPPLTLEEWKAQNDPSIYIKGQKKHLEELSNEILMAIFRNVLERCHKSSGDWVECINVKYRTIDSRPSKQLHRGRLKVLNLLKGPLQASPFSRRLILQCIGERISFYANSNAFADLPAALGGLTKMILRLQLYVDFEMKVSCESVFPPMLELFTKRMPNLIWVDIWNRHNSWSRPYPEYESGDTPGSITHQGQELRALIKFAAKVTQIHPILKRMIISADSGHDRNGHSIFNTITLDRGFHKKAGDLRRVWGKDERTAAGTGATITHCDEVLDATVIRKLTSTEFAVIPLSNLVIHPLNGGSKDTIGTSQTLETSGFYHIVHDWSYPTVENRAKNTLPWRYADDLIVFCRSIEHSARHIALTHSQQDELITQARLRVEKLSITAHEAALEAQRRAPRHFAIFGSRENLAFEIQNPQKMRGHRRLAGDNDRGLTLGIGQNTGQQARARGWSPEPFEPQPWPRRPQAIDFHPNSYTVERGINSGNGVWNGRPTFAALVASKSSANPDIQRLTNDNNRTDN